MVACLLYGSGLRLMESVELRVKDLDLPRCEILVRDGKGRKDRRTILPEGLKQPLTEHLRYVRELHERDLKGGAGLGWLPDALERKYPNASREWGWQWVFPASSRYFDHTANIERRHHLHESVVQKAVGRFTGTSDHWEMHPHGSEVVLCITGSIMVHQELSDGSRRNITLVPGQYAINGPGTWHTVDAENEATVLAITPCLGTERRMW